MDTLLQQIKEGRETKDKTLNNYKSGLNTIAGVMTGDKYANPEFLRDVDGVMSMLNNKYKNNSIKNKLTNIIVGLSPTGRDKWVDGYKEVGEAYQTIFQELAEELKGEAAKQDMSKADKDKWCEMAELIKIRQSYAHKIRKLGYTSRTGPLRKPKHLDLIQKYLVASLYTMQNCNRNTYGDMEMVDEESYEWLEDDYKQSHNFLVVKNNQMKRFMLGDTKTSFTRVKGVKTHTGIKEHIIGADLNKVINLWLNYNPIDKDETIYYQKFGKYPVSPFLLNTRGKMLGSGGLTKYIQKVFEATGKKISSSTIRKIKTTEKMGGDTPLLEKQKMAFEHGHSISTQALHYTKN